jgi:hypothetical protein
LPAIVSAAGAFGKQVAAPNTVAQDTFLPDSYWWLFRELLDRTKGAAVGSRPGYYPRRNAQVRARFDALEADFEAELPAVIERAVAQRHQDPSAMAGELDAFTARCIERVLAAVHELLEQFAPEETAPARLHAT